MYRKTQISEIMRYWHILLSEENEVKEQYLTSKSNKDFGLTQKSKQFNWTYEVHESNY